MSADLREKVEDAVNKASSHYMTNTEADAAIRAVLTHIEKHGWDFKHARHCGLDYNAPCDCGIAEFRAALAEREK